jgi:hypothetical protein
MANAFFYNAFAMDFVGAYLVVCVHFFTFASFYRIIVSVSKQKIINGFNSRFP